MPVLDSVNMVSVLDSVSTLFVQASECEHGMCSGLCECYVSHVSMVNVLDSWCSDFVSRTLHHGMFVSWTLHTGHVSPGLCIHGSMCLQDSTHMACVSPGLCTHSMFVSWILHAWHVCLQDSLECFYSALSMVTI